MNAQSPPDWQRGYFVFAEQSAATEISARRNSGSRPPTTTSLATRHPSPSFSNNSQTRTARSLASCSLSKRGLSPAPLVARPRTSTFDEQSPPFVSTIRFMPSISSSSLEGAPHRPPGPGRQYRTGSSRPSRSKIAYATGWRTPLVADFPPEPATSGGLVTGLLAFTEASAASVPALPSLFLSGASRRRTDATVKISGETRI